MTEPAFTIGIEEEYMLVNPETGDMVRSVPDSLLPAMQERLGERVSPEFLQSQIEVGTPICHNIGEAREALSELRATVSAIAAEHDMAIIACSTHPFARPEDQEITPRQRYTELAQDLQGVIRRFLISGMHVHVGIGDDELRVDLMNQTRYILPHLLSLSTSSPFWQTHDTGLKSYRMAVWSEMPRTGLPPTFDSYSEYQRHVNVLVDAGVIEDATKIWWDLRPSVRFPTLEMRISDLCTNLEDTLCIAALYTSWLRMLYRLRRNNQKWRNYSNMLIDENRWRAHRYGIDAGLIDFGRGEIVSCGDLVEEILQLVSEDAEEAGCLKEVQHARTILQRGTSAHAQLQIYSEETAAGKSGQNALETVVQWLIRETVDF